MDRRNPLKYGRLVLYILVILFLGVAFWLWRNALPPEPDPSGANESEVPAVVSAYLEALPLEARIGQLIMVGFSGHTVPGYIANAVTAGRAGGIILFADNLTGPEGTASINRRLQEAALESESAVPLFIAADEEGGRVTRVPGILPLPGNMVLGATGDPDGVEALAAALGSQLRHLGINMNMAPVVDVNNNPANPIIGTRSFGEDPEAVGVYGAAFSQGLQSAGVAAVAKHFPGHGDTDMDSHTDLPVIPHDLERLRQIELPPFEAAIDAGVHGIMTAHIVFEALEDRGLPATLSPAIIQGLLRQELGYDGVVMTDALEMAAIAELYSGPVAGELALAAGVDLLVYPAGSPDAMVDHLVSAVEDGRLSHDRIDEALRRVLILKYQLGLLAEEPGAGHDMAQLVPFQQDDPWPGDLAADRQLTWEMTLKGLTAAGEGSLQLPQPGAGTVLVLAHNSQRPAQGRIPAWLPDGTAGHDWTAGGSLSAQAVTVLGHFLETRGHTVQEALFDWSPTPGERSHLRQLAAGADVVIVMTRNANHYLAQSAVIDGLLEDDRNVIHIAMQGPYDRSANPAVPAFLATYYHGPLNTAAAAAVLTGEAEAGGSLPVAVGE